MDSTSDRDTFVAADLGWFDPFYTEKPAETGEHIEQEGSKNIYRDVFSIRNGSRTLQEQTAR